MPQMRVLDRPLTCAHCGEPFTRDQGVEWLSSDEARHTDPCVQWAPVGPLSDGTLRCDSVYGDLRCQRRIPVGWHANEGHPGGHWFEADANADARRAGLLHTDARALLAGEPYDEHAAADCPDSTTCPHAP